MNREQRRANGIAPAPPPAGGPQLQFGAVPVTTNVQPVDTPEGARVVLVVTTPQGVQAFFFSAEHARQLSSELATAALSAKTGIIIAGQPIPADPEPS